MTILGDFDEENVHRCRESGRIYEYREMESPKVKDADEEERSLIFLQGRSCLLQHH